MRPSIPRALLLGGSLLASCTGLPRESGRTRGGVYYEVEGSGPPILLVHAFSMDRRMWDAQVAELRSDHRMVRYDLLGHGLSDPWTRPFSPVQNMLDVFDAAGMEQATIIGLSAGAEVALDFALAHPERVSGLVLASPGLSGYRPVGSFDWMAPVTAEIQAENPEGAAEAWAETPLMAIPGDPRADSLMGSLVSSNSRIWTYDPGLRIPPESPAVGRLPEIQAPTLILVGERDLIDTRRVADTLAACLPRGHRVTLPGVGHLLNLQAPEAFLEAVESFLRRARPPPVRRTVGC